MTRQRIPDDVLSAAHARARAREARDWPEADRLRDEIEAAGWKIVDRGTDFALSPAAPPDVAEVTRTRTARAATCPPGSMRRRSGSRPSSWSPRTGRTTWTARCAVSARARHRAHRSSSSPTARRMSRRRRWRPSRPNRVVDAPDRGRLDERAAGSRRGPERRVAAGQRVRSRSCSTRASSRQATS